MQPVNVIVSNVLFHSSPHTQTPQIIHILHFCLVDLLLNYVPGFCGELVEAVAVWRPQICRGECMAVSFTQLLHITFIFLFDVQLRNKYDDDDDIFAHHFGPRSQCMM